MADTRVAILVSSVELGIWIMMREKGERIITRDRLNWRGVYLVALLVHEIRAGGRRGVWGRWIGGGGHGFRPTCGTCSELFGLPQVKYAA